MEDFKIIHDAIHGSIKFEEVTLRLLETPEMQRLSGIKQLGLGYLVFPGANHTRLEHSIGVGYVAGRMGEVLRLPKEEINLLKAAGMLHDLGHSPFSHTLEYLLYEKTKLDHMEITTKIIEGKIDLLEGLDIEDRERIHEILGDYGLDTKQIGKMILGETEEINLDSFNGNASFFGGEKNYLVNMISGSLDADQIDYLLRDAHYTGVAHGAIDFPRILHTLKIKNGELMIDKKGVPALEGMLVARALMYSAVYFHKTNRIGELMLSRAVEEIEMDNWLEIYRYNDSELISLLLSQGGYPREIALRIKYRKLFKKAMVRTFEELENMYGDEYKEILLKLCDLKVRRKMEREIAEAAGIDERYVLIDIPSRNVILSEPRLTKTNVKVVEGEHVYPLSKFSPLARALQTRKVQDWAIMVVAPKENLEKVKKVAERIIFY
ncbi:HD domain-containing protein [Candidatus Aciduliprofundum boonei]|uniref:Metal dependent phosphohydrolase n=1 Tax=Aciduliprofundum boonei (strain DSM 19572 / T469) TaxID=439481 RepID=D3TA10_ACIB4|nr:HD domain-containing protein [Candidatus Aciduliprofundum boonei]ADD08939.1 metal dependent phosphohydrolase [Aciduliprofundum boonei T469]HII54746.1 HD domain-containing protein [Candidatus Aciduliprofundum boonei]